MLEGKREMLRHALATLAYRSHRAVDDAPHGFGDFSVGEGVRTPHEIVAHMSDLMAYTLGVFEGAPDTLRDPHGDFAAEISRFFALVAQLASALETAPLEAERLAERLLQGPIADAITHVGQLALMRRLAGAPIPAEDFSRASIHVDDLSDVG